MTSREDCPVCYVPYDDKTHIEVETACHHAMCLQVAQRCARCPMCREHLTRDPALACSERLKRIHSPEPSVQLYLQRETYLRIGDDSRPPVKVMRRAARVKVVDFSIDMYNCYDMDGNFYPYSGETSEDAETSSEDDESSWTSDESTTDDEE